MKKDNKLPIIDVKKYGGKQVAIADGRIIASGTTLKEVIAKAQKHTPKRPLHEIRIFSVPRHLSVVYYA